MKDNKTWFYNMCSINQILTSTLVTSQKNSRKKENIRVKEIKNRDKFWKKGNSNMSTSREFQPYSELRETALESILYQMGSTDLTWCIVMKKTWNYITIVCDSRVWRTLRKFLKIHLGTLHVSWLMVDFMA